METLQRGLRRLVDANNFYAHLSAKNTRSTTYDHFARNSDISSSSRAFLLDHLQPGKPLRMSANDDVRISTAQMKSLTETALSEESS